MPDPGFLFKGAVWFLILLFLVSYIFVHSKTLEITEEQYIRNGMPYTRNVYNFHWERFSEYVKAIPDKVKGKVQKALEK